MPTKKTVTSTKAKKSARASSVVAAPVETVVPPIAENPVPRFTPKMNTKFLVLGLVLVGVGLLTYKLGPWLVPAVVDKTPITRWQLYEKLEQTYAPQVLSDLINEQILESAIAKTNVTVDQGLIDARLKEIEDSVASLGGLDEALKSRGMTKAELISQIKIELSLQEILKDKLATTDEEAKTYFDQNSKTIYVDKKFDDVKAEILETLKQNKFRDAFMTWFEEAKKSVSVKNFQVAE